MGAVTIGTTDRDTLTASHTVVDFPVWSLTEEGLRELAKLSGRIRKEER
jgi:hypothetical protein